MSDPFLRGRRIALVLTCLSNLALGTLSVVHANEVDIPYTRFVLDNGLTLIVHEDHKAPIVCVNVWYHVGSKNEKVGKTGFAHLFEHLMFNGSENFDDDYFRALDQLGATSVNGTTWLDRTNYFQNVPITALDAVLWMESDRMGHMLGAVTQERLDEQRGVVQNEKRQGDDQPYSKAESRLTELMFPAGHPYSWDTIGSMADLEAASLQDVHEWFEKFYGAANATLVIAGDINTDEVHAKVVEYFGDIDAGPVVSRLDSWAPRRVEEVREIMEDRVPQARLTKAWVLPEYTHPDRQYLDLVSDVLAQGKTSRLFKRLVYDDQIATNAGAAVYPFEIAGVLQIDITAQPGGDLAAIEQALDEEMARLLHEGPTEREISRVQTQHVARLVRGLEEIGSFGGKAQTLAMNQVYAGSPDHHKVKLQRVRSATPQDLRDAAREWLSSGATVIEVYPFPEYSVAGEQVDRTQFPMPESFPEVGFPAMERATLDNGLEVILVGRHAVPVVDLRLIVGAGHASDQLGLLGTSSLAVSMMEEDTKKRNALEISEELARLGATMGIQSTLDQNVVSFSALTENLDASLDVFADVVLNPAFPGAEFNRVRNQRLAGIQREKAAPRSLAYRLFPPLLYGADHAYGLPLTGTGTEASVSALTRIALVDFHKTWFRPNNATLVVVGATTLESDRART
jgi:zinc protease